MQGIASEALAVRRNDRLMHCRCGTISPIMSSRSWHVFFELFSSFWGRVAVRPFDDGAHGCLNFRLVLVPQTGGRRMTAPLAGGLKNRVRGYLAAIAIFCNEMKGKSALALSGDLGARTS
jgi:hypothetical protein